MSKYYSNKDIAIDLAMQESEEAFLNGRNQIIGELKFINPKIVKNIMAGLMIEETRV